MPAYASGVSLLSTAEAFTPPTIVTMCIITTACRSGRNEADVAKQGAALRRLAADLAALQRSHGALLAQLPNADGAPTAADVRAHYEGLRHAQRAWEDRMTALLDAVSALQSPASHARTGA